MARVKGSLVLNRHNIWLVGYLVISFIAENIGLDQPWSYGIPLMVLFPLLAPLLPQWGATFEHLHPSQKEKNWIAVGAFVIPACFLFGNASFVHLIDMTAFWIPFSLITLGALAWFLVLCPGIHRQFLTLGLLALLAGLYGHGTTKLLNAYFDKSGSVVEESKVLAHRSEWRFSRRSHYQYYVTLSPVGPIQRKKEFRVSDTFFQRYGVDSPVAVISRKGYWGIPWYHISGFVGR